METLTRQQLIKRAMVRKGFFNQTALANALGVDQSRISTVLSGKNRDPVVRKRLAGMLGISQKKLWPPKGKRNETKAHIPDGHGGAD